MEGLENNFRRDGIILAGRSRAAINSSNLLADKVKCFWSASAAWASLHALFTMKRLKLSPRRSAPRRINLSSSRVARRSIRDDRVEDLFFRVCGILSSVACVHTLYVHTMQRSRQESHWELRAAFL